MKISKYGVTLHRIRSEHIELIRKKRNSADISRNMLFREKITPGMQKKWFAKIHNPDNYYYLIEYKSEFIGLVNDKNIDWVNKTSEGGMFIWEKEYKNSPVPLLVSFLMIEIAFYILNWNETSINVLKSNEKALDFNKMLGFVISGVDDTRNVFHMKLNLEKYEQTLSKLKKTLTNISQNQKIKLFFEPSDDEDGTRKSVDLILANADQHSISERVEIYYP